MTDKDKTKPTTSTDGFSRRIMLKGVAGSAAILATPGIIGRAMADDMVVVNSWGGNWLKAARKNLFDPFTAATGIRVETVSPVSFAKLKAQAKSGAYDFDVSTLGGPALIQAANADVLEPMDKSIVTEADFPKGNVIENGVASHAFSNNIVYRTDKFPDGGPETWKDFWDTKKYPGARTIQNHVIRAMTVALAADGVVRKGLYPLDADRAFKSLDKIKSDVRVWWKSGAQSRQLLQDGEVVAGEIWGSGAKSLLADGVPIKIVKNEMLIERAFWVVSKGTPRAKNAWKYIKFATSAKPLAGFAIDGHYGPMNPKSFEFIDKKEAMDMPTYPDNLKNAIYWQDVRDTGNRMVDLSKRFERWIAS